MRKLFFFLSPIVSFQVVGNSMLPAMRPGQKVVVQKRWFFCSLKKGDVVVLRDPRNKKLILKRISAIRHLGKVALGDRIQDLVGFWTSSPRSRFGEAGQNDERLDFFVLGDNPQESTDSRTFGWIRRIDILGKVIYAFV